MPTPARSWGRFTSSALGVAFRQVLGESEVAGKPLKERGTNAIAGDVITSKWEYSTDGSTWKTNFEQKGTRVK